MRVVLYARGASAESVQKQFAELRRFAGAQGWRVVGEFNDVATYGTSLERAGLHQLRAQVESPSREFEVVLVTTIDRLAREFYDLRKLLAEFDASGVAVRTLNDAGNAVDLMKVVSRVSLRVRA